MGQINNGAVGGPFLPLAGGLMTGKLRSAVPGTAEQILLGDGLTEAIPSFGGQLYIAGAGYGTVGLSCYGSGAECDIHVSKANGTKAVPTALGNNSIIGGFNINGFDGTAWLFRTGGVIGYSMGTWASGVNAATEIRIMVTKTNTVGSVVTFTFNQAGGLSHSAGVVISPAGNPVSRSYTVALAPATGNTTGEMIYITNPAVGTSRPYWWNGTQWRDAAGTLLA